MRDVAGDLRNLPPTGPAVGLAPGMTFRIAEMVLQKGEYLFVYTDGVTEAQNHAGDFFGSQKLYTLIAEGAASPMELVEKITSEINLFQATGGNGEEVVPSDDITMLTIERY